MEFNKLVFPAPMPSYDETLTDFLDEPGSLIYIPRFKPDSQPLEHNTTSFLKKDEKKPNKPDGYIPCLYLPYMEEDRFSNTLLIFFHGNAEDIYLAYDLLKSLRKELKVFAYFRNFCHFCNFFKFYILRFLRFCVF